MLYKFKNDIVMHIIYSIQTKLKSDAGLFNENNTLFAFLVIQIKQNSVTLFL